MPVVISYLYRFDDRKKNLKNGYKILIFKMNLFFPIEAPTVDEPLKFFDRFFETNAITIAYHQFFPDPSDRDDHWHSSPVSIDWEKGCFTLEYSTESGHMEDGQPVLKWEEAKYCFEEELNKKFKQEFFLAKKLCAESIRCQKSIEKAKLLCNIYLSKLLHLYRLSRGPNFNKYNECTRPISRLLYFLYEVYKNFLPKANANTRRIISLWDKQEYPSRLILELEPFVAGLMKLYDENDNGFVGYSDETYNHDRLTADLVSMFGGNYKLISKELNFTWEMGATCYLFCAVLDHCSLTLKDVMDSGFILLKGQSFKDSGCSVNATKYGGKKKKLKFDIDQLIQEYLNPES